MTGTYHDLITLINQAYPGSAESDTLNWWALEDTAYRITDEFGDVRV